MKIYQIDYDLRKQRNYDDLYVRIKSYGDWCHALESTWFIKTNQSAAQVRDYLMGAIDRDDGLIVTRSAGEAAWYGLSDEVSRWLKGELDRLAA
jgi:hypothetical protein